MSDIALSRRRFLGQVLGTSTAAALAPALPARASAPSGWWQMATTVRAAPPSLLPLIRTHAALRSWRNRLHEMLGRGEALGITVEEWRNIHRAEADALQALGDAARGRGDDDPERARLCEYVANRFESPFPGLAKTPSRDAAGQA